MHRAVAAALLVAACGSGGSGSSGSSADDSPPSEAVTIEVRWPGTDAGKVETSLTNPLEMAASQLRGIARITSVSQDGHAVVTVEPQSGTDIKTLTEAVQNATAEIDPQLPSDTDIPLVLRSSHRGREVRLLYRPAVDRLDALFGFDHLLLDQILRIPGISLRRTCGDLRPEYRVIVDPRMLAAIATSLDRVVDAIDTASPTSADQLGAIVITGSITVKDVAMIEQGFAPGCDARASSGSGVLAVLSLDGDDPEATWKQVRATFTSDVVPLIARHTLTATIELPVDQTADAAVLVVARLDRAVAQAPQARWMTSELTTSLARVTIGIDKIEDAPRVARMIQLAATSIPGLGPIRLVGDGLATREVALRGPDLAQLRAQATGAVELLHKDPDISSGCTPCTDSPRLDLEIDRDRAARLSITPSTITAAIRATGPGIPTRASIALRTMRLPILVTMMSEGPEQLREIPIPSTTGTSVPLEQVVTMSQTQGPTVIRHENRERVVIVWATGASDDAVDKALRAALPGAPIRRSRPLDP